VESFSPSVSPFLGQGPTTTTFVWMLRSQWTPRSIWQSIIRGFFCSPEGLHLNPLLISEASSFS
jgi:hypothetical protein